MLKDFPIEIITGNEEIDLQHMELVSRIKILHESFLNGTNSQKLIETFKYAKCYIKEHFSTEENFMLKHNYPYYERHLAAHSEFIKDYLKLEILFQEDGASTDFNLDFNVTLIEWLKNHVLKEDKILANFIRDIEETTEDKVIE